MERMAVARNELQRHVLVAHAESPIRTTVHPHRLIERNFHDLLCPISRRNRVFLLNLKHKMEIGLFRREHTKHV